MNLLQNPNKRRWYIVATIFVAIICNYLDRQLLSILKPEILTHSASKTSSTRGSSTYS